VRPAIYSSGYNQHPPRLCDTMTTRLVNEIIRCPWGDTADSLMREYHDTQWGKPCRDERTLFEMLTLEGAQAGLSWATILHNRENYRTDNQFLANRRRCAAENRTV